MHMSKIMLDRARSLYDTYSNELVILQNEMEVVTNIVNQKAYSCADELESLSACGIRRLKRTQFLLDELALQERIIQRLSYDLNYQDMGIH